MTDIIDFEDKRKERFGKQNKTEVEGFDEEREAAASSDEDSQENVDFELASEPALKTPANKSTQAERLIRLAHQSATFFHTSNGEAFGCMQIGGHQEIWSLRSKSFKIWLRSLLFRVV